MKRVGTLTYRGKKRYVRLDVSSAAASLPVVGAVAILTEWTDPTQPPIKIVPALHPDDSPEARARFEERCARATALANQAVGGGATIDEAKEIARAFLRNEVDAAELQAVAPQVRSRQKSNENLKRKKPMVSKSECLAQVTKCGTQEAAAVALGISARQLRRVITGK